MKEMLRAALRRLGVDVRRHAPPPVAFLREVMELYRVDVIFDVGAHVGESGTRFRQIGCACPIISFEPVTSFYEHLHARAVRDGNWVAVNVALGKTAGRAEMNVSGGHGGASSLMTMSQNVRVHAPDQLVIGTEPAIVMTLDSAMRRYYPEGDRCFLKMDVQGYERHVIEGGLAAIDRVVGMELEMSLVQNYEGETLLADMLPFVYDLGFRLVCFRKGWSDYRTREAYQVNGVFFRPDRLPRADSVPTAPGAICA